MMKTLQKNIPQNRATCNLLFPNDIRDIENNNNNTRHEITEIRIRNSEMKC